MSDQKTLILTIKDLLAIQRSYWDVDELNEFSLKVVSGEIRSIQVFYNSVLVILFESGELRLDIDIKILKNFKWNKNGL